MITLGKPSLTFNITRSCCGSTTRVNNNFNTFSGQLALGDDNYSSVIITTHNSVHRDTAPTIVEEGIRRMSSSSFEISFPAIPVLNKSEKYIYTF